MSSLDNTVLDNTVVETENKSPLIVEAEGLVKIYKTKDIEVVALQGLDLDIHRGELMAIIGSSGSGKSTLLNMIGGLDRPSAGKLLVDGKNLLTYTDAMLTKYRRDTVGFVWQNNARNLVPYLTALENVELPMLFKGRADKEWAKELLDMVGLTHRYKSNLNQLSGGEQQRVAIAIALANKPQILLADEPTGAVDTSTANQVLDLFNEINKRLGITIIIVTHDTQLRRKVGRVVNIRDGITSSEFIMRDAYKKQDKASINQVVLHHELEVSHEEFVALDKVGKMQLPQEYMEKLGVSGKSKLRIEYDEAHNKVILSNPEQTKKDN